MRIDKPPVHMTAYITFAYTPLHQGRQWLGLGWRGWEIDCFLMRGVSKNLRAGFFFFFKSAQIVSSINTPQVIPFLLVCSTFNIYFFTVSQWIASTKDWRQKEKGPIEESITDSVDMNLSRLKETVEDRGTWLLSMGLQRWTQHSHWATIAWYQSAPLWSSQIKLFSWKAV